jgi:integrase
MTEALAKLKPRHKLYLFPEEAECARNPRLRAKLSVQFARLCVKAGIEGEGKSFHSLRHTYVTAAAKAGIPIEHISQNVGHASISMTRQYIRP